MPLDVCYWRNDKLVDERRLDWLPRPCDHARLQIMVGSRYPPTGDGWIARQWHGHVFCFRVPHGEVQPVDDWPQTPKSEALYPYWWNLCETYSNCPFDLAVQILPAGSRTSLHRHKLTKDECFLALAPDGLTHIRIADEPSRPLTRDPEIVRARTLHQLFREEAADDFSVQLLRMHGPVRFPDRSDHYCVPQMAMV